MQKNSPVSSQLKMSSSLKPAVMFGSRSFQLSIVTGSTSRVSLLIQNALILWRVLKAANHPLEVVKLSIPSSSAYFLAFSCSNGPEIGTP